MVETLWKKGSAVKQNATYGYDRASNRTWRRNDLAHDKGGTEAIRHDNFYWYYDHYYYNTSWRAVEEYRNTAPAPVCRYLWGLRSR